MGLILRGKQASRLLQLYEQLTGDFVAQDDPRRPGILSEMSSVVTAPTAKDARSTIEWWGWDSRQQMDAWIRKARKLYDIAYR